MPNYLVPVALVIEADNADSAFDRADAIMEHITMLLAEGLIGFTHIEDGITIPAGDWFNTDVLLDSFRE